MFDAVRQVSDAIVQCKGHVRAVRLWDPQHFHHRPIHDGFKVLRGDNCIATRPNGVAEQVVGQVGELSAALRESDVKHSADCLEVAAGAVAVVERYFAHAFLEYVVLEGGQFEWWSKPGEIDFFF